VTQVGGAEGRTIRYPIQQRIQEGIWLVPRSDQSSKNETMRDVQFFAVNQLLTE
jgi:hypothetical protein